MEKRHLAAFGLLLPVLLIFSSYTRAQTTYIPLELSGFTEDIVANGSGPGANSTTADMDGGPPTLPYAFVAEDYVSPTGASPSSWLPTSGTIVHPTISGLQFYLQPYDAPNSLRLSDNNPGTLSLATPFSASEINVLAASGRGNSDMGVTVTFTDGTTQDMAPVVVNDWFDGTPFVIQGVSRINLSNDLLENSTVNPRLYNHRFAIDPANYGRLIQNISFTRLPSSGSFTLNVMAVTAGISCITAPEGGTLTASVDSLCPGNSSTLTLAGQSSGANLNRQWQFSTDGGTTWQSMAAATTSPWVVTPDVTTQYRVRIACGPLGAFSTVATVVVRIPVVPTVTYSAPEYCQSGKTPAPRFTPTGGRFSAMAGTVVDSITGVVDLQASATGQRTILYRSPAPCPQRGTARIRINPMVQGGIAYTADSYCQLGSTPAPALTPTGGSLALESGLSMDTLTGIVNLAASTPGLHYIRYTPPGTCPVAALDSITIIATAAPTFPNIVTPNQDEANDQLRFDLPLVTGYNLQIYNSWGRSVWQSDLPGQGWEGSGQPSGLYYYQVEFSDCTGRRQSHRSWVELAR